MAVRGEQERRGMKSLLGLLAPFRKPMVMAALGGFAAGALSTYTLRGVCGGGWGVMSVGSVFSQEETRAARDKARHATHEVWNFLNNLGDSRKAYEWWYYLRLNELQMELSDPDYASPLPKPPASGNPQLIDDIIKKLQHPALERQEFVELRGALSAYAKVLQMSDGVGEGPAPPAPQMATQRGDYWRQRR